MFEHGRNYTITCVLWESSQTLSAMNPAQILIVLLQTSLKTGCTAVDPGITQNPVQLLKACCLPALFVLVMPFWATSQPARGRKPTQILSRLTTPPQTAHHPSNRVPTRIAIISDLNGPYGSLDYDGHVDSHRSPHRTYAARCVHSSPAT